jgi:hypothetical protein
MQMNLAGYASMKKALLVLLIAAASALAQGKAPKTQAAPKTGKLTGRIFAITSGGDIKPARLATLYLFYQWDASVHSSKQEDYNLAAAHVWSESYLSALKNFAPFPVENACQRRLLTYQEALLAVMTWANDDIKRIRQVVRGQADEEGLINMPDVPSGTYILVAFGRAGFNDAVWVLDSDEVVVKPGMETAIKAASPAHSCLKLD